MSLVDRIKELLDQGDYLEADRLSNDLKVTAYQNLVEVPDIAASIKHHEYILSSLEAKIKNYDSELRNVKDTAFQMEEKEHAVQVQCKNLNDTCLIIQELIENLRIPDHVQVELLESNLNNEVAVEHIEKALGEFEKTLNYEPGNELRALKCVIDQKRHAENIKEKFGQRFYHHFTNYVDFFINDFSESLINTIYNQSLTLPEHDAIHNRLLYLIPLVGWLWRHDISIYEAVNNFYLDRSKTQYDKEFKVFFECARERMTNPARHHGRLNELTAELRKRNSTGGSESGSTRASYLSGGGTLDTQDTVSAKGSDISYTGWEEFDAYIEEILRAINPCCIAEQQFYSEFFPTDEIVEASDDATTTNPNSSEHHRQLVTMFSELKSEFIEFANYYNSQNGLYSLYLLVRLSQYLARHESNSFFLLQIYREIRIIIKRNFDNFMEQQLNTIRELRAPKQSKCGVLSVVKSFDQFAKQVESLFKSIGSRRSDIDRWYPELVSELFKVIDKMEHNKTPSEMIRLENYNYLHDVLRSIKVPCLEKQRKEANSQYKDALNSYVARYFGRPLEKLNIFFDGVQAKIAQGVKEEEISFQLAFSKQELRKVLNLVTLREVRKGLEEMYRRIEKHASEPDSNLIQVIWHAMQEEFLTQYKAIQGMIERCYPYSNLSLTFTINDVLQVFSDIAQSH